MIADFVSLLFVLGVMLHYKRRGLLLSVISSLGWLIAVAGAFFLAAPLGSALRERTDIEERIRERLSEKFAPLDAASSAWDKISGMFGETREDPESLSEEIAGILAGAILTILVFFIAFTVLKMFLRALTGSLRRSREKEHKTIFGKADSLLGLGLGLIIGFLLLLLIYLALIPVLSWLPDDIAERVLDSFSESDLSGPLFYNNPLSPIFESFEP